MNTTFSDLKGKTLVSATRMDDSVILETVDGWKVTLQHWQDCCECVEIKDISGDLSMLLNYPILMAEEVTNDLQDDSDYGIGMWTFYKLATIKGYVTITWYGSSNGYYSVDVDCNWTELKKAD